MATTTIMNELEAIIKYKMTEIEAKAFKVCLMWQDLCKIEFPNEHQVKLNINKDPRKTSVFKYCYKLIKETKGLLSSDKDYYLYIKSQLQVMKLMRDGKIHALVEPQILVGDKAWKRWTIWKRKYDKKIQEAKNSEQLGIIADVEKIKIEISKTREFLNNINLKKCQPDDIIRWINTFHISPYYVCLCEEIQTIIKENNLKFQYEVYRPSITPEIEEFFNKGCKYEKK